MKSVAILAVLAVTHTSASMLRLLPGEPCVAHGNSSESQSVFNITKIFTYPVEAAGGGTGGDSRYYFDCATGITQTTWNNENFQCGLTDRAIWFGEYNGQATNWTVLYPTDSLRVARVTFVVDPTQTEPTFKALGEYPYTEYNFEVSEQ